jgi:hypothetical protein
MPAEPEKKITPRVKIPLDRHRVLWLTIRRALLMVVAVIERFYGREEPR